MDDEITLGMIYFGIVFVIVIVLGILILDKIL